ncbi:MAG: glycosyltransferase family 39 protein [Acidobacteriota bacterium]
MENVGVFPDLSVVVPALNERGNLSPLVAGIEEALGRCGLKAEILIADGGSTDGTREEAEALAASHPLRFVAARSGRGLAGDVLVAARQARAPVVVVMDADGSHDPAALPEIVRPVLDGSLDVVVGSRYVPGGRTPGWPLVRRFLSRLAGWAAWPWADVADRTSGYFAVRRDKLLAVDPAAEGFKILLEVLLAPGEQLRAGEVPISFCDRRAGSSKMSSHQLLSFLRRLSALAGGEATPSNAAKFSAVGLVGLVVDLVLFQLLWSAGLGLSFSHIASFLAATLVNYALNGRWAFRESSGGRLHGKGYLRFLAVASLAMLLRGGVLALCHDELGWPALLSVVAAIGATALVNYFGALFFVFTEHAGGNRERLWRTAAVGLTAYVLLLRLAYLGVVDLMPEEAYYWNYAQHPALGYLDHPPMVAWLISAGTALFGHTEFGVRIGAYLCWLLGAVFLFAFARNLMEKATGLKALLLFSVLPFFFTAGFLMTPDAPLTACWAGTLFFLERALLAERPRAWWGVGVLLGLGLLSKYSILLLAPPALLFLVWDRRSRRWFVRPEPYAGALAAALLFYPVLLWNAENGWASFWFQTGRRIGMKTQFSPHLLLGAILLLLTPVGAVAAYRALAGGRWWRRGEAAEAPAVRRGRFVALFTLGPLAVFALFSLTHEPKLEWTGPLWLAVLPAVAWAIGREESRSKAEGRLAAFGRRGWVPTFIIAPIFLGGLLHYLAIGLPGVPYPRRMDLPVAWQEMGRSVARIRDTAARVRAAGESTPITLVGMDKYFLASELAFYGGPEEGGRPQTASRNLFGLDALMYDRWAPAWKQSDRWLLLVSFKPGDLSDQKLAPWVAKAGKLQTAAVLKGGREAGRFYYRLVHYNGPAGSASPHRGMESGTTGEQWGVVRTLAVRLPETSGNRPE